MKLLKKNVIVGEWEPGFFFSGNVSSPKSLGRIGLRLNKRLNKQLDYRCRETK
jgi:hypothetical protein